MNRLSLMVDSVDFLNNKNSNTKKNHSGSLSDLSQSEPKHTGQSINREDSILSKVPLFSKKTYEGSWSNGSVGSIYTPRPEKTMLLFEKILQTLSQMYEKYNQLTILDDGIEHQDYNEICTKIDDRMRLIQTFKANYESLLENKKVEYDKIQFNFRTLLSNKNHKQSLDLEETDAYWSICRELFLIESKLEKCTGKLQFQIMDLESISKLNPMDQYELVIKLNETKFKTKIKIEKSGHQLWDMRHFDIIPNIDDSANIKFSELKPLNKSIILIDMKLPFVNDLIKPSTSIFNCWLTPLGTIKLNVIVQWNAQLEDSGLQAYLNNMDNKFIDNSSKNDVVMRSRASSYKHSNKLSVNIENLFRSSRSENPISNLMSNIFEDNEDEKKLKETKKKSVDQIKSSEIQSVKTNIENEKNINENSEQTVKINVLAEELTTTESIEEKSKATVLLRQKKINISIHEDSLPNEDITSISKEEIPIQNIQRNLLNDLKNNDEIIESPIIAVTEMAIENVEKEKNEVIIEDNYIVENESLSSMIDTVTNEHSPEKVTNNEIEVEINIDSSEVESIEQSIDDNIKLHNEDNCNIDCFSSLDRLKLESDAIEDNELGSTDDIGLITSEIPVSHIVPVDEDVKLNHENICNIDYSSSSPNGSKLESYTIEDNELRNTDDVELMPSELTASHIVVPDCIHSSSDNNVPNQ